MQLIKLACRLSRAPCVSLPLPDPRGAVPDMQTKLVPTNIHSLATLCRQTHAMPVSPRKLSSLAKSRPLLTAKDVQGFQPCLCKQGSACPAFRIVIVHCGHAYALAQQQGAAHCWVPRCQRHVPVARARCLTYFPVPDIRICMHALMTCCAPWTGQCCRTRIWCCSEPADQCKAAVNKRLSKRHSTWPLQASACRSTRML